VRGDSILRVIPFILPLGSFASEIPTFISSAVVPANASRPAPLQRSMLVSIYGRDLGPSSGCTPQRGEWEPQELCAATVTIGGQKAGLLYVQNRQINLRVPLRAPTEGMIDFVVTYNGRSSVRVPVRFAVSATSLKLTAPAYVDMPIWIEVNLPYPHRSLRYPVTIRPADFGGHRFEVRRNGIVLPQLKPKRGMLIDDTGPSAPGSIGGGRLLGLPSEPKNASRLPLHLLYRFDRPGVYEVRYTGHDEDNQILVRSPWLRFIVKPFPAAKRAAWLATMRESAPSDPVELVSDFLPSLLVVPDHTVLSMLKGYLHNPDSLVREYAKHAIYAFDDALIAKEISDADRN
jgi:hypothetical protein